MPLPLTNQVKGQLTQMLLSVLLEGAGYRITRLGIEEIFYELRLLDQKNYLELHLPQQLRALPDFIVLTSDLKEAHLVEVKFRREFSLSVAQELYRNLSSQRELWPSALAVIMVGKPAYPAMRFHQDYMRVVLPGEENKLLVTPKLEARISEDGVQTPSEVVWNRLPMLFKAFPRLVENGLLTHMDSVTAILKSLSALSG